MKIKLNAKNIVIYVGIIVVIILGIVLAINDYKKNSRKKYPENELLTSTSEESSENREKNFSLDIESEEKEDEELFSDEWKEYLKLSEEEKSQLEVLPRKYEVPEEKFEEIEEKEIAEEPIPESFNLAEKLDIEVEDQLAYGLCWDFASMQCVQTHNKLNHNKNDIYSKMHLNYFTSELLYGSRPIHEGGNFQTFNNYNIKFGEVLDKEIPYKEYKEEQYEKFIDAPIESVVTESVDFPKIHKDGRYTDEEITEYRNIIKKHLMKNGSLYASVATPDSGTKYYNTKNNAECFLGTNKDLTKGREKHAVSIVGWDDNYSKDNFNEGMRPKNDGAYIALNSWGKNWHDNGLFYISYEDLEVEKELSGVISTSMEDTIKINSIKNTAIRNYLKNNYGQLIREINGEECLIKVAIDNIHSLDFSNQNFNSIEGIEIFRGARNIDLSNNNISDLTPLVKMKSNGIYRIDLSNNNISSISELEGINIETINLSNNKIINIEGLDKNDELYDLNLSNNKIKDVSNLGEAKRLTYLKLDGNENISGINKLNNISDLSIADCNISDLSVISGLENLKSVDISNTPGIQGLDKVPKKIGRITLKNCELDSADELKECIELRNIDLSNNNIDELDFLKNFKFLNNVDISKNPIKNWNWLGDLKTEFSEDEDYWIYQEGNLSIYAKECDFDDISVFNALKQETNLYLDNCNISDISKLNNSNISSISLNDNKGLTGLEGLSNIQSISLKNCNIDDREIPKLTDVTYLDLTNNNIKEIDFISNLKNLEDLVLDDNFGLKGKIVNDRIRRIKLNNCNLDNSFSFEGLPKINHIELKNNPNYTEIYDLVNRYKDNRIYINVNKLSMEDVEKIQKIDGKWTVYTYTIEFKKDLNKDNNIDLKDNKIITRWMMKNARDSIEIDNGRFINNKLIIKIDDVSKENVIINCGYAGMKNIKGINSLKIVFEDKNRNDNRAKNEIEVENEEIAENLTENETSDELENFVNVENIMNENVDINKSANNVLETNNVIINNTISQNETIVNGLNP